MTLRTLFPPTLLAALLLSSPLGAQDSIEIPTAEEYAEKAAEAAAAPLFQSDEPIKMTLTTDIEWLRDERIDSMDIDGTLTYVELDGSTVETPIEVRTRGNFRRDKRNCNFPPIRLDFPKGDMDGTLFEGQDKLKLVTPCNDGSDRYQRYILREYLVYRAYQLITPESFRVRLVEITYVDIEDDYDSRTKIGFLIESDEQMAERNRALYQDVEQFHPGRMDPQASIVASVFNYMIGNTDFSSAFFHNSKLIRREDASFVPVLYDFDFSGAVNARYATPDPSLPIRRVKDRLYRGFCRPELQMESVRAVFNPQRDAIFALHENEALLHEDDRKEMLEFYEDFFEILNNDRQFERRILEGCRNW